MNKQENTSTTKFQAFIVAVQFLSVIPVGKQAAPSEETIGASLSWYPVVGIFLGMLLCASSVLLNNIFPPLLAAALILTIWVTLSGGLHLDGFADSADAWMGGLGSKEKTLRLLKDPTSGPIAIAAIILLLLLKLFAIDAIIQQGQFILLLWPLIIGRISVALLFVSTPYARESGLGSAITKFKQDSHVWFASSAMTLFACYFLTWMLIPLLITSSLAFWYLRSRMIKRLDGCTGDTAGALLEIIECISLLCLVACVTI